MGGGRVSVALWHAGALLALEAANKKGRTTTSALFSKSAGVKVQTGWRV